MTNVSIQLVDENGKEIYTLNGVIEETKAGETANRESTFFSAGGGIQKKFFHNTVAR